MFNLDLRKFLDGVRVALIVTSPIILRGIAWRVPCPSTRKYNITKREACERHRRQSATASAWQICVNCSGLWRDVLLARARKPIIGVAVQLVIKQRQPFVRGEVQLHKVFRS